jgi:GTP cyclohydrolase I
MLLKQFLEGNHEEVKHENLENRGKLLDRAIAPNEMAASLIIQSAGEDLKREGLLRTPERFSKAVRELTSGYVQSVSEVIGQGVFEAEGQGLVSVKNVEFYSLCEHHLLPFWGKVSVAYYPDQKIVGLSKIPRIVDLFARRFQVQERLTRQVAEALQEAVGPRAVAVRMEAAHLCMMMRGVEKQSSTTMTEFAIGLESLSEMEKDRLWKSLL